METNIFDLPLDILRDVWNYLSTPDMLRFGMTAKNMINRTWIFYREVETERGWPIDAHSFVLSQPLSHIKALELCLPGTIKAKDESKLSDLLHKLDLIAETQLPNLQSLVIDIEFTESIYSNLPAVNKLIQVNTQLQSLRWCSADVDLGFNIGQFLSNHTRLTSLAIETKKKPVGISNLTQLKDLDCSFIRKLDDECFSEIATLQHLTSLHFSLRNNITDDSFTKISNLINLEELDMNCESGISSMAPVLKLPNLRSLTLSSWGSRSAALSSCGPIVGQLSNLTHLSIEDYSNPNLDVNLLTGLTSLLELAIRTDTSGDFSNFSKLTKLAWQPRNKEFAKMSHLPKNLKAFCTGHLTLDENSIMEICSLENLKNLQLRDVDYNLPAMVVQWITKLTRLTEMTISPNIPNELIRAFVHLPNLVSLTCKNIPTDIIEDLAKLTQLMEITYWGSYRKGLQAKLPFRVLFTGVRNEEE